MTPQIASTSSSTTKTTPMFLSRLRRPITFAAVGLTAAAIVAGAGAVQPASADAGINTVGDVNQRTGPGTQYDVEGVVPSGVSPDHLCWVHGQDVGGVDVWFRVQWQGQVGFISSYLDDSSYASDDDIESKYGIPACGSETVTDGTSDSYDRAAAASWAYDHATDPQDFAAGCTWFVSQALWAGGLPKTAEWTDANGHGHWPWSLRPGTPEATAVNPFREWLLEQYPASTVEPLDFTTNAVPDAEPGDLIVYDWEGGGEWDHFAIVTSIADGSYPNVAEWGTSDAWWELHPTISYHERGWTWSEKHGGHWLQEANPNVTAELIHIDPSHPLTY